MDSGRFKWECFWNVEGIQKDRKTERQKDRKTERQKDRKTERQKERKADRQKDRRKYNILVETLMFNNRASPPRMKVADCGILLPRTLSARVVKMMAGNSTRPPTAKLMCKSPAKRTKIFYLNLPWGFIIMIWM
jgi:hypothetical protein